MEVNETDAMQVSSAPNMAMLRPKKSRTKPPDHETASSQDTTVTRRGYRG